MSDDVPAFPWRRWGWLAGVMTLLAALVPTVGVSRHPVPPSLGWLTALGLGCLCLWLVGQASRQWRSYQASLQQAAIRDAVLQDRMQVASELHDIVSHSLGAITLRAREGKHLAGDAPEAGTAALGDIAVLAHSATDDLRALLTVLQNPEHPAPLAPAPQLADAARLVDNASAQGLRVTALGLDAPCSSAAASAAAYHVIREALANTARHAGPTDVRISVRHTTAGLQVEVLDGGPAPGWTPEPGAGHGLALVARRISALGGWLAARPEPPGFRTSAAIPEGRHHD